VFVRCHSFVFCRNACKKAFAIKHREVCADKSEFLETLMDIYAARDRSLEDMNIVDFASVSSDALILRKI